MPLLKLFEVIENLLGFDSDHRSLTDIDELKIHSLSTVSRVSLNSCRFSSLSPSFVRLSISICWFCPCPQTTLLGQILYLINIIKKHNCCCRKRRVSNEKSSSANPKINESERERGRLDVGEQKKIQQKMISFIRLLATDPLQRTRLNFSRRFSSCFVHCQVWYWFSKERRNASYWHKTLFIRTNVSEITVSVITNDDRDFIVRFFLSPTVCIFGGGNYNNRSKRTKKGIALDDVKKVYCWCKTSHPDSSMIFEVWECWRGLVVYRGWSVETDRENTWE